MKSTDYPKHLNVDEATKLKASISYRVEEARRDCNKFIEYCFKDEKGDPIQQAWFHKEWHRYMDKHERLIVIAFRNAGKCQSYHTLIQMADGTLKKVGEIKSGDRVIAWDGDKLVAETSSDAFPVGPEPCITVRTQSGREITCTADHPFLTWSGWKHASELSCDDRVAVPRSLPGLGSIEVDKDLAWLIGFMIADGSLTQSTACFTKKDEKIISNARRISEANGWSFNDLATEYNYSITNGQYGRTPKRILSDMGLCSDKSTSRLFPEQSFTWTDECIASMLAGYFDGDGTCGDGNGYFSAEYNSVNRDLLVQTQLLLDRLGIWSQLSKKMGRYLGEPHESWRLVIRGQDVLRKMHNTLPLVSEKADRFVDKMQHTAPYDKTDLIPKDAYGGLTRMSMVIPTGRLNVNPAYDTSRDKIRMVADHWGDSDLIDKLDNDLRWDKVSLLEDAGDLPTYGIEVENNHNHITNGIITHNTSQIIGRVLWEIGNDPNKRIKIVAQSDSKATERLFEIVDHMQNNPRVKEVFPDLRHAKTGPWTKHKVTVERDIYSKDASIEAIGITASATGGRADLLIGDDCVDRRNSIQIPALRHTIKHAWKSDWTNLLEPQSKVVYICTLWHVDDLSHMLMRNPMYKTVMYNVNMGCDGLIKRESMPGLNQNQWPETDKPLWLPKWSQERLQSRHDDIGTIEFDRAFRNIALSGEYAVILKEWILFEEIPPLEEMDWLVDSFDPAESDSKTADYMGNCLLGYHRENKKIYVIDWWHYRGTMPERIRLIKENTAKYNADTTLIERAGGGISIMQSLDSDNDLGIFNEIKGVKHKINKAERLARIAPYLERAASITDKIKIVFNQDLNRDFDGSKRGDLIRELTEFPIASHDDILDAFTQGAWWLIQLFSKDVPVNAPTFKIKNMNG